MRTDTAKMYISSKQKTLLLLNKNKWDFFKTTIGEFHNKFKHCFKTVRYILPMTRSDTCISSDTQVSSYLCIPRSEWTAIHYLSLVVSPYYDLQESNSYG